MMDFLEHTQKQKKDLEESMKESFRQRDERLAREKKKKGGCGCGRSPTGLCIGWHSFTEEKYLEYKKKYKELKEEDKKKNPFHARAIDGFGE